MIVKLRVIFAKVRLKLYPARARPGVLEDHEVLLVRVLHPPQTPRELLVVVLDCRLYRRLLCLVEIGGDFVRNLALGPGEPCRSQTISQQGIVWNCVT